MKASSNYCIPRPDYLALDGDVLEYTRKARTIGELPTGDCNAALQAATAAIGRELGLKVRAPIKYGTLVFKAMGLTLQQAKIRRAPVLLLQGSDVPLERCECYEQESD